jgi:hypothetical protein
MSGLSMDIARLKAASDPAASEAMLRRELQTVVADAERITLRAEGGDVGAPFEPSSLVTLRGLVMQDFASWTRLRKRLRSAGVQIADLDRKLKSDPVSSSGEESAAEKLMALARDRCRFMHDAQQDTYAVFEGDCARQVYRLDASSFSSYLSHTYYALHDRAPSEAALKVAIATLRGQALYEGDVCEVFTRIAKTKEGYWLDLCDESWRCVHITPNGWTVVAGDEAPLFVRSSSMRALPLPERGGSLDPLWDLVNIPASHRLMVLTWVLECLRCDTPHVVLELVGEQGSAKSSTQRVLRRLFDPNQADLRAAPKSVDDVWVSARNSHLVSLENLSCLSAAYQDALCVLATGGGRATRKLYTDAEESIMELRKPIVLNGISVIVTAQDLLDRCLHVDLPVVDRRELAAELEMRFEAAQPLIIGAVLDLFVNVLASLPTIDIAPEDRPRMADFAALGEAVYRVHGYAPGSFLARYHDMRKDGVQRTIEANPVGSALTSFLTEVTDGFIGTLSDLLARLQPHRSKLSGEGWPSTPKALGDELRRFAPALRLIGWECKSFPKTGGVIRWQITPSQQRSACCKS